jgi:hypothetical protein
MRGSEMMAMMLTTGIKKGSNHKRGNVGFDSGPSHQVDFPTDLLAIAAQVIPAVTSSQDEIPTSFQGDFTPCRVQPKLLQLA